MRPGNRKPPMNWLMLFVLAVVILGILLLVTDEFGTALIPLDALNTAAA